MKMEAITIVACLAIAGCISPRVQWTETEERGFPPLLYRKGDVTPFSGTVFYQHPNGNIQKEQIYRSGHETGLQRSWYPNGQKQMTAYMRNGLTHGKLMEWHENGQIALKTTANRGTVIGSYQSWSPDGTLTEDTVCENTGSTLRRHDPAYLKTLNRDAAASKLEITLPIEILSMSGYEDGGSIGCVAHDATGKSFSFFIDYKMSSQTRGHYYLGSDYPDLSLPAITMLPKGDIRETAIKVLLLDWVDRHYSRRQQKQILEDGDDLYTSSKEHNARYILWLFRRQDSNE